MFCVIEIVLNDPAYTESSMLLLLAWCINSRLAQLEFGKLQESRGNGKLLIVVGYQIMCSLHCQGWVLDFIYIVLVLTSHCNEDKFGVSRKLRDYFMRHWIPTGHTASQD